MLVLYLVLGGGFFCGYVELEYLLGGGRFYREVINSLEELCAYFFRSLGLAFLLAMLCIYTIIDRNYV